MYGFGVAHLDRAASGLTPSSATSRTPDTKAETGDPQSSGRFAAALGVKPSRLSCRPVDLFRTRQLTSQALRGNHHVPFAGSAAPFSGRATPRRSCANHHHSTLANHSRRGSAKSRAGSHRTVARPTATKKGQTPGLRGPACPGINTDGGSCLPCNRTNCSCGTQEVRSGRRGRAGGNAAVQGATRGSCEAGRGHTRRSPNQQAGDGA